MRIKLQNTSAWKFAVDRGGTFTDIIGLDPEGKFHTLKLLSSSPDYEDASMEGVRKILRLGPDDCLPGDRIEAIRFGTTVATNALLERKGGRVALLITKGFSDLLEIGYQNRPDIFSLCIKKPSVLYTITLDIEERIDSRGKVIKRLNRRSLEKNIKKIRDAGIDAVSVVFLHSWRNPEHELLCEKLLVEYGISNIFLSHRTINLIKVVGRGQSTVADAYLSPVIARYLEGIKRWIGNIKVEFIQSSGRLATTDNLRGKNALFSGPAGGVIAVVNIAETAGIKGAIGFDMGGTSTDVSRYDGDFERIYEQVINGIELQVETLNINTVASGGGSILWFDGQKMRVGPESAGAYPGPACYGFDGPITITDANLITGRIVSEYFPRTFGYDRRSMLDINVVKDKFHYIVDEINKATKWGFTLEVVALGFLRIANEKMALAIKEISVSRGFDVRDYSLICFGGAGGQHACQVASILGVKRIFFHPLSGVMSAYGIGLSQQANKSFKTVLKPFEKKNHEELAEIFSHMEEALLHEQKTIDNSYFVKRELDMRPVGTETCLTVQYGTFGDTEESFRKKYQRVFGFCSQDISLEVVNLRLEVQWKSAFFPHYIESCTDKERISEVVLNQTMYYPEGPVDAPVYIRDSLPLKKSISGPALIIDRYSTLVIDPGFKAEVDEKGMVIVEMVAQTINKGRALEKKPDPVLIEVFNNLLTETATEMGYTLKNTAHSVNIKERLDFSCAVFDGKGSLVANAPHIPVHLGSMVDAVKGIIEDHRDNIKPGDVFLSNNPYRGGSHLPDMTTICPVFSHTGGIIFFTASRGHHADIGGITPGSLPPEVQHIEEEGVLIDSFLLVRGGRFREEDIRDIFTNNRYPVRNINERILDLKAQVASCQKGVKELKEVINKYGLNTVRDYMKYIQENASFSVKQALYQFLKGEDTFESAFEDYLDDGTPVRGRIVIKGELNPPETLRAVVDFTGTGTQHLHDNLNTPLSVTRSAVLYVLRTLTSNDIPLNSGCLTPVDIIIPEGSILNPAYPAPVASGNVETSQRIVDVLLGALGIASASQGTMNNLLFEVEGDFPYYETIAGGSGAIDGCPGASGVQVHMTNTRITDPEILEYRHPDVRLERFTLRRGSGGKGLYPGGEGVVREIKFLKPATVSIISERRVYEPYGIEGGNPGKRGANLLKKASGEIINLPHRVSLKVSQGDSIIIKTPGGGGFGKKF
jgi:5-oxoprolinase (ATP-hydrolysing)